MSLRIRRGTDLERSTQLFDQGEIVYTTDTQRLYIGDGSTLGGVSVTGYTTAEAQDAAATIFTDGSHTGISFDYDDITKTMNATVTGGTGGGVTYGISSEATTGGVNLRLSGSDASADNVKFAEGSNITLTRTDASTITIASTASGSALTIKNEGTNLTTSATSLDFVGAGVTATNVGDAVTVTINGGGVGATALSDLTDVSLGALTSGEVLTWNGLEWINSASTGGLASVSDDTTPMLGGNLDLNGFIVNGEGSIDIATEILSGSTISITTANNTNTSSIISLSRSNGTLGTPAAVADADDLGGLSFSGHDGTGLQLSSYITASTSGSVTTGIVPSRLLFGTTDATGDLATRVTIDDFGGLNALYGLNLISTDNAVDGSSLLRMRRSRGTTTARTTVQTGDRLSQYLSFGYDGTDYVLSSAITVNATDTVSTGIVPSSLTFSTTNSSGNLTDAVAIGSNGHLKALNSFELYNVDDSVGGPNGLEMQRARGTIAAPTTVIDGDSFFQLTAKAHDGTTYVQSSAIRFQHEPGTTIATNQVPGRITFLTADSSGVIQPAVYIDNTQRAFYLKGITHITDGLTLSPIVSNNYHNSGTTTNNISLKRYRGTSTAPTAVQASDPIMDINWMGYDGVTAVGVTAATIRGRVLPGSTVTTGNVPGQLIFQTRNLGGTMGTRFIIDSGANTFVNMVKMPSYADEATAAAACGGTPTVGMIYFDTGAGKLKGYGGGVWNALW